MSEDFWEHKYNSLMRQSIDEKDQMIGALYKYKDEISRLREYERAIKRMCTTRLQSVEDYIMAAKQAVANYEEWKND